MRTLKRLLPLLCATIFLAGCVSTITNLTPSQLPRNSNGLYPVSVAWDTQQQTVRPQTLTPYVIVGLESYPMRPTLLMSNRWETVIPVPSSEKSVRYHFKVDYEYNAALKKPQKSSKLSKEYTLEIAEK